jgi:BASS family bile acid:Na+ symporter
MLQRFLILWLVLGAVVAAWWPTLSGGAADPFLLSKPHLGWLVALTMFCVGSVLPADEAQEVARRWPLVISGTAVQYLAMPALAWGLTRLVQLDPQLETGVILAGCVPGAMASNVLTMVAKGNVSYSVGLTTLATLLSPIIVPLALKLTLGASASSSLLANSAMLLCTQVVAPVLSGFGLSRLWPGFSRWAERWAGALANVSILWIISVVVALNRANLQHLTASLIGTLLALNIFGYGAGSLGGRLLRLSVPMRRALMLEVGMQNAGLGASLATSLFPDQPGISLPCGLFAFGCMFTGTVLAQLLGRIPLAATHVPLSHPASVMTGDK